MAKNNLEYDEGHLTVTVVNVETNVASKQNWF
jgi:hypothetical protein